MTSLVPQRRRIAHVLAAAAVLALAVGVAVATAAGQQQQTPLSNGRPAVEAAAPLPAGIDPAMQTGGRSSSTTTTSSSGSSAAGPIAPMATDPAIGTAAPMQPPPSSSPAVGEDGSLQLVDLMQDACFAPTGELSDYNE